MADHEHPVDDRPLLIGEVLAFASAGALERAAMAIEDLGGLSAGVVGDPPVAGPLQVQLGLGDQVLPERHLVKVTPLGGESVALAFRDPFAVASILRALAAPAAPPPVDAAAIGLELQPVDASSIGLELVEVPPEEAAPTDILSFEESPVDVAAIDAAPAMAAPPAADELLVEQAAAAALAALTAFESASTGESVAPPPVADETPFDDSAVQTVSTAAPAPVEVETGAGVVEVAAAEDAVTAAEAALDVAALDDLDDGGDFEDAPTTEAALAIEAAGLDEEAASGDEVVVEPEASGSEEIVVELVGGGGQGIVIGPASSGDDDDDDEEIEVEPVKKAPAAETLPVGIVLLIEDTLTFDSAGAVVAFVNELQEDGGVVVESLGAQLPESGQVELGLSLAGQASATRHAAVAMQEDDDRVALVFRNPDDVVADLRRLGTGKPAEPAATPTPKTGPKVGGPTVELDLDDDLAAVMAEAEAEVGNKAAKATAKQGPSVGPADDLGIDGDLAAVMAAAAAEVEGGGRSRKASASDDDEGAGSAPLPKGPRIAASKLPPPLPEEEKALAGGALVNPVTPKDLLTLRLAKQVDPRGRPQQSLYDLLGGLALIRATGELHVVCGDLKFMLPFLSGIFFARDDEIDTLVRAMKHPTGRFALLDMPVTSNEKSRNNRPPRVMVVEILRRVLLEHDPDTLQAGLAAIRYKYALTVPNISYVALGFKMTPKENVFMSDVCNGTRAVSELAGSSASMTFGEAAAFVYLCVIYDMIKLLDEPREIKKSSVSLKY